MTLIAEKELFLFDFDGTLANTSEDITASINYMLNKFELGPIQFDIIKKYIGIGLRELIEGLVKELSSTINTKQAIKYYKEHHIANLTNKVKFYPGVVETLQALAAQQKTLGIISNKYSFYTSKIVEHLRPPFNFDLILGPDNVKQKKPAPDSIYQAAETLNIPLEKCVIVGDSPYDIKAGNNAGITSIAVTYGFHNLDDIKVLNPTHTINNFTQLLTI